MLNSKIFKEYDIRGVYPKEINEDTAYKIGRAFVEFLGKSNKKIEIVIGRDGRKSSPSIFESLKKGMIDSGANVLDIGLANTPLLNFTVCKKKLAGGVMVTASHNPPNFNGLKLIKKGGLQVYGKEIQEVRELSLEGDFREKKGDAIKISMIPEYVSHIMSFTSGIKDIKAVVDYGNGVGSVTGKPVFERLKIETINLYDNVDGSFPGHLPSPEQENMEELIERVKKEKADLGIFFDGDGDRAFFVDEKGNIIYPDLLTSLLIEDELYNSNEKEVYFDLRFSKITAETIKEAGGVPVMMKVGNPFYKEKLIKEGGLMGAELSGHVMHKDNFSIDDGLFIAIKTIKFLSNKKETFSEMVEPFKKYYQSREINIRVKNKEETLEKVKNKYSQGRSYDIDGVYIKFKDWWFNLRKSNTEDLVRLRIEADSQKLLEEKEKELTSLIGN